MHSDSLLKSNDRLFMDVGLSILSPINLDTSVLGKQLELNPIGGDVGHRIDRDLTLYWVLSIE